MKWNNSIVTRAAKGPMKPKYTLARIETLHGKPVKVYKRVTPKMTTLEGEEEEELYHCIVCCAVTKASKLLLCDKVIKTYPTTVTCDRCVCFTCAKVTSVPVSNFYCPTHKLHFSV